MIVDQTRNRPSALAFAAATSASIFAPPTRRPAFPAGSRRWPTERELVAVRQQHAARENLGAVAHRRRARDRHAIADANRAPVYAAIPQDADRRRFGIPHGLHAFLVLHGQEDLSVRIAPRHRLDDAGDFDRLPRIEDSGLAVMRVSKAPNTLRPATKLTSRNNRRMLLSPPGLSTLNREMPLAPVRHSADRRRVRERYEGPRSRRTGRARFDRSRLCPRLSWTARARRVPLHSPC